jgi:hypothetical protein
MNEVTPAAIESIVTRAEAEAFPAEPLGLAPGTADASVWRAVLALAPRERVVEISGALDAVKEARREEQDEAERAHARAVLEGREPLTPEEESIANQERIEAEAERQDFIARRPERVEALLERILAVLEQR